MACARSVSSSPDTDEGDEIFPAHIAAGWRLNTAEGVGKLPMMLVSAPGMLDKLPRNACIRPANRNHNFLLKTQFLELLV